MDAFRRRYFTRRLICRFREELLYAFYSTLKYHTDGACIIYLPVYVEVSLCLDNVVVIALVSGIINVNSF